MIKTKSSRDHTQAMTRVGVVVFLLFVLPVLSYNGYRQGDALGTYGNLIAFFGAIIYLRFYKIGRMADYFIASYLVVFIFSLVLTGYVNGSTIIWIATAPPFAFLCLGTRPGIFVSLLFMPLLAYALFFSELVPQDYFSIDFRYRFFVAYMLIATLSTLYSYFSDVAERDLAAANARISSLEMLIPMCMHCKNIRDEGSWIDISEYLTTPSTKVSHGICPGCVDEHYGELLNSTEG